MPAIEKMQEGKKYKSHPDRWNERDLRVLDRLIHAFGSDNPLTRECVAVEHYDDLRTACLPSWTALRELKKYIVEQRKES